MFTRLSILFGLCSLILSGAVRADSDCKTLAECQRIRAKAAETLKQADAIIWELDHPAIYPKLGPILRNADKKIKYMTFDEALKSCPEGSRLPTAKEFASVSRSLGAVGSIDPYLVDPAQVPPGYNEVYTKNPNMTMERFFFSNVGYRPIAEFVNVPLWSSSVYPTVSEQSAFFNGKVRVRAFPGESDLVHYFDGTTGNVGTFLLNRFSNATTNQAAHAAAVRCVIP